MLSLPSDNFLLTGIYTDVIQVLLYHTLIRLTAKCVIYVCTSMLCYYHCYLDIYSIITHCVNSKKSWSIISKIGKFLRYIATHIMLGR